MARFHSHRVSAPFAAVTAGSRRYSKGDNLGAANASFVTSFRPLKPGCPPRTAGRQEPLELVVAEFIVEFLPSKGGPPGPRALPRLRPRCARARSSSVWPGDRPRVDQLAQLSAPASFRLAAEAVELAYVFHHRIQQFAPRFWREVFLVQFAQLGELEIEYIRLLFHLAGLTEIHQGPWERGSRPNRDSGRRAVG